MPMARWSSDLAAVSQRAQRAVDTAHGEGRRATKRIPVLVAIGAAAILLALAAAWVVAGEQRIPEQIAVHVHSGAAPLCPWREPGRDLAAFFPGSTGSSHETRVLSGQYLELKQMLGRPPESGELALNVEKIYRGRTPQGQLAIQRVKGAYGAIEVVTATDTRGRVVGVHLQRLREPASVADAITSPRWLAHFRGKTARDSWRVGTDVPDVVPAARVSASAVVEGVHSLVILMDVASRSPNRLDG
jgi:hypothetical protein